MLGCREVDERLLPLLYGEVPGHEAEALRAHLRGCPGCAASYERLAAARGIARRTQWTEEPPAWLDEAVRRRVAELFGPPAVAASARPGVAARLWAWLTSLASGPQVAMATLMLLVVAIGIWQLPRDEVDSGAGRVLVNVDSSDGVVGTSGPTPAAPLELRVDPRSKRLLPAPAATLEPATAVGGPPPVAGAGSAGSPHKPPPARAGRGGASERHGAIPGSVAREETRVADVATPHERTAVAHPTERAAPGPTPLEPGAALEAPATSPPPRPAAAAAGSSAIEPRPRVREREATVALSTEAQTHERAHPSAASIARQETASRPQSTSAPRVEPAAPRRGPGATGSAAAPVTLGGDAFERGMAAATRGEHRTAVAELVAFLGSAGTGQPGRVARALHQLARSQRALGALVAAVGAYERLVREHPSYSGLTEAYVELGDLYESLGRTADADRSYAQAERRGSTVARTRRTRGTQGQGAPPPPVEAAAAEAH